MGCPLGGTRAGKLRFASSYSRALASYSRAIGGTYDGPCRPVKLGRPVGQPGTGPFQQSASVPRVHPVGQHRSGFVPEHVVIGRWRQAALQVSEEPVSCSVVHGSPSSGQVVGQLLGGSHVSPAPTRLSPHFGAQSLSFSAEQASGQQPSFGIQPVMRAWLHAREQPSTDPDAWSNVQASPSSQVRSQAPGWPAVIARSQRSLVSTTPSPQIAGQSLSSTAVHPGGQQRSPPTQAVIGVATHAALQKSDRPVRA